MGRLHLVFGILAVLATPAAAEVSGMTALRTITPDSGLIENAIASDGAGLVAYVQSDGATTAEVHVIGVAAADDWAPITLTPFAVTADRIWFVGKGKTAKLLVLAHDDDGQRAALFDGKGKQLHLYGPGEAVALVTRKGKSSVAVRTVADKRAKSGLVVTTYTVTRYALDKKGKRVGKPVKLSLERGGIDAKRGFTLDHWTGDGMVAVGMTEGEYDQRADVHDASAEGVIDLADAGKLEVHEVDNPIDLAKRFEILRGEGDAGRFARITTDLTGVEAWKDDQRKTLTLDQSFDLYDPKSLVWAPSGDDTMWIGLSIDPWNQPAVTRKKADPEYFDLYKVDGDQATRVARRAAPKGRFLIGAAGADVWLLERNAGFDGGKSLTIYSVP